MSSAMAHNPNFYDYIVIGCGGIGSATVYWLSKRTSKVGARVLGLEQFKLGHDNGGSQDVSRIIRLAYHDDNYTALAKGTYAAWAEAERESGEQLVFKTGGLNIGKKGTIGEKATQLFADACHKQNIPCEILEGEQVRRRCPIWTESDSYAVYQKDSGVVDAARGNSTHIQLAVANGATVLENAALARIERNKDGLISVYTSRGIFSCRRVIVTAGAWTNNVIRSIGFQLPLTVTQEQVTFMRTPHIKDCGKSRFPTIIYAKDGYDFYAMPSHGNTYSKIGIDAGGPPVTAETRNFSPDPKREQVCVEFLKEVAPKFVGPIAYTKTCLYTMTPDRNFVIDTCANVKFPDVIMCCGAGHGYKFSAVLGQVLTDLAVKGKTDFKIEPFRMNRPAITDPSFKKDFHFRGLVTKKPVQSRL